MIGAPTVPGNSSSSAAEATAIDVLHSVMV